ncbi:hypothetical protein N7449_007960 [Penicillium cf. viridicatum]|uniref:Ketopantoate reductase N-terminal domain-containing protein n=1 Tax=Penicillium cf. viridicatum TaxID=2972119 RepID=A0A9W9JK09_9EURO|nr:hypothetical protein N7449_007960 [Penicillium cf. viridicatum]
MSGKAQVLLIGCGGVGAIAALNLETGGHAAVTVVLRSNYSKVISDGFHIKSCDHGDIHNWKPSKVVNTIPTQSEMCFDYVVITTKNTPDYPPTMADLIEPAIVPGETVIVLIQNGLNIEKPFLEKYPDNTCLSGVSLIGSHETAPAVIEHEDPDRLIIGVFQNPLLQKETGDAIAHHCILEAGKQIVPSLLCSIPSMAKAGLQRVSKSHLRNNRIGHRTNSAYGRHCFHFAVTCNARSCGCCKGCGVILPSGIEDRMINIDPLTMYLHPSMLEDGNLVEFETLVGEPLREGLSGGVSMPTLTVLYHTLKVMKWRLKEQRGIIDVPAKGEYLKNGSK